MNHPQLEMKKHHSWWKIALNRWNPKGFQGLSELTCTANADGLSVDHPFFSGIVLFGVVYPMFKPAQK